LYRHDGLQNTKCSNARLEVERKRDIDKKKDVKAGWDHPLPAWQGFRCG